MSAVALDHVQLAIPVGGEGDARAFYGGLPGLEEVAKPKALAGRGGLWLLLSGGVGFHLGADPAFRPAGKAHPALRLTAFGAVLARLERAGHAADRDTDPFGRSRAYACDPFGTRLELIDGA